MANADANRFVKTSFRDTRRANEMGGKGGEKREQTGKKARKAFVLRRRRDPDRWCAENNVENRALNI